MNFMISLFITGCIGLILSSMGYGINDWEFYIIVFLAAIKYQLGKNSERRNESW